ncbi:MAG: hypothetical protein V2I34_09620 [Bacteroidales bacterium]|jgi:hypothetical protein|nr:hypothetical protein [Bacteroidales bacterium]
MKTIYLSIVISILSLGATAQNLWLGAEGQRFYDELLNRKMVEGETATYEGSPYMNEEFREATLVSSENQVFTKVPLRYNVYYDLFEVEMEDAVYNLNRGSVVAKVEIDGHRFIYSKYEYQSSEGEGYLEVIIEGPWSLYKQHQVVFREAVPAQPYQEAEPASFEKRDPLFYVSDGDELPVFIRNRKGLLELAGDKEKELNNFLKDNKIKLRDEAEMKKAVEFLNGIE